VNQVVWNRLADAWKTCSRTRNVMPSNAALLDPPQGADELFGHQVCSGTKTGRLHDLQGSP
jgi:hypothetical protein